MGRAAAVLLTLGILGIAPTVAPARAGDPPAAEGISPADRKKIAAWIDDLDHAEYPRREAATKALRDFGGRALPFLEEAEPAATEEARTRIRLLALVLRAGLETESGDGWYTLKGDPGRTGARGDAPG